MTTLLGNALRGSPGDGTSDPNQVRCIPLPRAMSVAARECSQVQPACDEVALPTPAWWSSFSFKYGCNRYLVLCPCREEDGRASPFADRADGRAGLHRAPVLF